jgi:hypothetical protein
MVDESRETEANYVDQDTASNPKGKQRGQNAEDDPVQAANQNDRKKAPSNPKMPPSGNLEYAGQSDNTKSS